MDVLVFAGGKPDPEDPLFSVAQGKPKALIDVAGKPMAQWVLDAVSGAKHTEQVIVVGLDEDCGLHCARPLHFVPDRGGLIDNAVAGMRRVREISPAAEHALVLAGDTPAITPQMIDWRIEQTQGTDVDVDYAAIKREVMETRYPGSSRSYVRLRDVEVCGGDMHVVRPSLAARVDLVERLIEARKNVVKQAALIGFDTLFLLLTRRLTLKGAEKLVSKRLGVVGSATLSPYAEIGMDVDKPFQLEIMRRDLSPASSTS